MSNQPFNNDSDQKTRRQVLKDTLLSRALADAEIEAQGRFKRHNPTIVTGGTPQYPTVPNGPWSSPDPTGPEQSLGYDINALPETGEASAPTLPCVVEPASSPEGRTSNLPPDVLPSEMVMFTSSNKYHVFERDVLGWYVINAEVPMPDDEVDIDVALAECKGDVRNANDCYEPWGAQPSSEGNWRILLNHRAWCLFWSIRHPNAGVRELEKSLLDEFNKSIERITAKARAALQRRLREPPS
jgi:hypothetical protein